MYIIIRVYVACSSVYLLGLQTNLINTMQFEYVARAITIIIIIIMDMMMSSDYIHVIIVFHIYFQ